MGRKPISLLTGACTVVLLLLAACGGGKPNNAPTAGGSCAGLEVDAAKITQPDGWKPNAGGLSDADLLGKGLELWKDKSLSREGNSACISCHSNATALYKESFATPFPHEVAMAREKAGKPSVTAAEMVQMCMIVPMGAKPLEWDEIKLAALTRAVEENQKDYKAATGK
ncbi:MAG: hypothetical protein K8I27_12850 [Planctomycetes bacterium]|nr:hypothetical protein [Planctomycetota bacterium]